MKKRSEGYLPHWDIRFHLGRGSITLMTPEPVRRLYAIQGIDLSEP